MVKFKPFLGLLHLPNFKLKIKLGVLLLCLSFLSGYQPYFAFPPVKNNLVYAQITQQSQVTPQDLGMTFQLPFEGYITTPYSTYHPGIDLCAGLGMPIKPIAKGVVVGSGFNFFGLGLVVEIDHGNGYRSLYAHMGKIYTEVGKEVNENSFLGEVGLTGNTSGPHTHLEVTKYGARIDPRLILPEIRNYPKEGDFVTLSSSTPSAVAVPASESTQVNPVDPKPIAEPVKPQLATPRLEEILPVANQQEPEEDLNQQTLNNILNVSRPKSSPLPIPQGGKLTLKNFTFPLLTHLPK